MTSFMPTGSVEEQQCMVVHHDMMEVVNRLVAEGVPVSIMLAAIGATAADVVTTAIGIDLVPIWFDQQAHAARALIRMAS